MAISNRNLLQTKKPFFLPLLSFLTFFLMLLCQANSSNSTDFEFSDFKPNQTELILQGDAEISSTNTLQLTKTNSTGNPQKNSVGRALYYTPVHLWDSTGRVASFETSFKFVISSPTREIAGAGLTLFFAPPETTIPADSDGGFLGLFSNNTLSHNIFAVNNSSEQILAVEFDTYIDGKWDPNYRHIGINVNTIRSRAEIKWERKNGSIATATIRYNTNNKKLYVVSSYSDSEEYVFSSSIDLQTVLPECVRVGFSASTGDNEVETHNILSWSFSSWLHNVTVANEEDIFVARYL